MSSLFGMGLEKNLKVELSNYTRKKLTKSSKENFEVTPIKRGNLIKQFNDTNDKKTEPPKSLLKHQ